MNNEFEEESKKAAVGAVLGAAAGLTKAAGPITNGPPSAQVAGNFAMTTVKALRAGAPVGVALGAGATAAVGGPAVVAAAVAAAPFVVGAAVIGVVGFGLYKLFKD